MSNKIHIRKIISSLYDWTVEDHKTVCHCELVSFWVLLFSYCYLIFDDWWLLTYCGLMRLYSLFQHFLYSVFIVFLCMISLLYICVLFLLRFNYIIFCFVRYYNYYLCNFIRFFHSFLFIFLSGFEDALFFSTSTAWFPLKSAGKCC